MKKIWKNLFILFSIVPVLGMISCQLESVPPHDIISAPTPLKSLGYWKSVETSGNKNSITIELDKDVDFLAWTKENGEFISLPIPRGKKFDATFKYAKGSHTFTFKEPGTYILNIHPTKKSGINEEDLNYRGKVKIGPKAIKITDVEKDSAGTCPRLGVYTVQNNSEYCSVGNIMTEFIYVEYLNKQNNFGIYTVKFKYTGLYLKPYESINLLFPEKYSTDSNTSSLILKPVVEGNTTVFYGQTVNRNKGSYSLQGIHINQHNGRFHYIGNNQFECAW